ncbi:MAG: carbohydrate ABC transporter permease [Micromonosporaceae bacterium]
MTTTLVDTSPQKTRPTGPERPRSGLPRRRWIGRLSLPMILLVVAVATVLPFLLMLVVALTPPGTMGIPADLLPNRFGVDNFGDLLASGMILRWTINSLIYAGVSTAVTLLLATMAGYAFAKKRFPGRELIFWAFLAMLMVPLEVNLIPFFVLVSSLGGVDTYWGLIVPTLANAQACFLMRQFIRQLPDELIQAAKVDGASEWQVFTRIIVPLARPAMAAIGVFLFLWHWNDFLWPLMVGQDEQMQTLTVGLATLQTESVPIGQQMAAATLAALPCLVIFMLLQRYLVDSIAATGLKS